MVKAIILTGKRETAHEEEWEGPDNLDKLQEHIHGHVEGLIIKPTLECYVNEEGLVNNMDQNESAAYMLEHIDVIKELSSYLIYGPMVMIFKRSNTRLYAKAKEWFDKYKADELSDESS